MTDLQHACLTVSNSLRPGSPARLKNGSQVLLQLVHVQLVMRELTRLQHVVQQQERNASEDISKSSGN